MRKPRVNRRMAFSQTALRLCEEEGSSSQEEFLLHVLRSEMANCEEVRRARFLHEAGFPVYKILVGYNFQSLRLPPNLSRAKLCGGGFIAQTKNLVLYGPVGTGNYRKFLFMERFQE
jgi:DNA replication protein DnaC